MNKRVLNLSLLMLLSAPFNAFGMDDQNSSNWKKIFYMFKPTPTTAAPEECVNSADDVLKTSSDALKSAIKVVQTSSNPESGQVQTVVNSAIEAIKNVETVSSDTKLGALLQFKNDVVKLGQLLGGGLKTVYDKAIDGYPALKQLVSSHPKISIAVGASVASAGSYGLYKYLSTKGIVAPRDDLTRNLGLVEMAEFQIDPELKATVDAEIEARNGDVNALLGEGYETRTPLMKYAEAGNANLEAVKYLVEVKGADLNIKDTYNTPRTVLIYPSFYGNAEIVEYLASRPDKLDTKLAREYAIGGFGQTYHDQDKYDRIMASLNAIDQKV